MELGVKPFSMTKQLSVATALLLFAFLPACQKSRTLAFRVENVPILAEGPLFEGANTAQGTYMSTLNDFLAQNGATSRQLHGARLTRATISVPDSLNLDLLNALTLQFAGAQTDMQKMGVLNPVPKGQRRVELQVAQEQSKVADFFRESAFTIVVDADVARDTAMNLELRGDFEFELEIKN